VTVGIAVCAPAVAAAARPMRKRLLAEHFMGHTSEQWIHTAHQTGMSPSR
jgi:hypothetical protein